MAAAWLQRIKELIPKRKDESAIAPASEGAALAPTSEYEPAAPTDHSQAPWWSFWTELIPAFFFLFGLALTVCSPLVGYWAVLGYFLLTGAPIVFYQQRQLKILSQILEATKAQRKR